MKPIEWLEQNTVGFAPLSEPEREAIAHFLLLWSYFEAKALKTRASSNSILALTHRWDKQGQLDITPFTDALEYFQQRYFQNGVATQNLAGLNLRKNDNQELVYSVLKGANPNSADCIAALLIIVYRFRNNLFHGIKWAYGIQGQLDNFTKANGVLMNALSIGNFQI